MKTTEFLRSTHHVVVEIPTSDGPKSMKFYSCGAQLALKLTEFAGNVTHLIVSWIQNLLPLPRKVEENNLRSQIVTTIDEPTITEARQTRVHDAITEFLTSVGDPQTFNVLAEIIVDSLRDEEGVTIEMVAKSDLATFIPMIVGVLDANAPVIDPLVLKIRRALLSTKETANARPTTG